MITPAYVHLLARYNAEMNRRIYGHAAELSDAQRREDGGAFFGSLHGTLSHILWGDTMWMSRFAGWARPEGGILGSPQFVDDFDELQRRRFALDADILGWAQAVSPDWLAGDLSWFSGATQREQSKPRALLVVHMFNHQTHHRGQAHALLTRFGVKTADTDLPFVLPVA